MCLFKFEEALIKNQTEYYMDISIWRLAAYELNKNDKRKLDDKGYEKICF